MAANPSIPRPDHALLNPQWQGRPSNEWYTFWQQLVQFVRENGGDAAAIAELETRVAALEAEGATDAVIQGLYSVAVLGSLADGTVTLQLVNDTDTPGNTYEYRTGPTGDKGWFTVASAFTAGQPGIELVTGSDGVTDIRPDDDLEAIEALAGTGLATRTASNTWATRTITAGSGASVTNGDGVAGNPTVAHADTSSVSDLTSNNSNGVVIQDVTITFDTFGHVQTVSVGTVDLDARYLQATSVGNGLKIVANVLSAGESGTEDSTTFLRGDGVWSNVLTNGFQCDMIGIGEAPASPTKMRVLSTSTATDRGAIFTQVSGDNVPALFAIRKARGTPGSEAVVQSGDVIGNFSFRAFNSSAYAAGGSLRFVAAATWTTTSLPAYFLIHTVPAGSTTEVPRLYVGPEGNIGINTITEFGGGSGVIGVLNATVTPTTNPTGAAVWYVEGGASKARGSSGTITTFAAANPHCPVCGSDFVHEWDNHERWGYLAVCMNCHVDGVNSHTRTRGAWNIEE